MLPPLRDSDPGDEQQLALDLPATTVCACGAPTPADCPYAKLWSGDKPEGRRPASCLRRLTSTIPF